jgi:2'-5' RNA ligase
MRDHWWWRPGWRVGRTFYTWHLTFERSPDVHRLTAEYEEALDVPGLDVIPPRWLHLTMQGIGFTDEVSPQDAGAITESARDRLAELAPFDATLGPAVIDPEVVRLRVTPAEPVARVRAAIRAAIADVWGPDRVPENEAGFTPHVSLAYSSADGPAEPIIQATESVKPEPATASIAEAQLIALNRDHREYQWTTYAAVNLGG